MIRRIMAALGGEGFGSSDFSIRLVLKWFLIQKIIGFNRHVPWPAHWSSKIIAPDKIVRGSRFPGLGMGCHIDGRNGIIFGSNVWIGPRVTFISMNHSTSNYHEWVAEDPIRVGNDCWFGANSVVLPSVVLGDHTVVAAGAVVTKSFPEGNQILAGNPAKVAKEISNYLHTATR
ncbi:acyltransferase [Litorivivens sp.]|uniref:acyltransferase n=1 Tax=Litorivivens sp. TaxID=2020868 RepID=UPI003566B881